ncbi:MAG: prolyl oligopeptidase family serine peptidase [Bacteroidia bacterium]
MVFAIAHIRGGGAMGRPWYEDGKLLNKRNTFTDFISCAEHLIGLGLTAPDRLAISGGSAGGLLMGAVVNMRPDLFRAVDASVPFVDLMNTMLDPSLPLTVIEYDEWGNPNEEPYFKYMHSYSPYDNVTAQAYPHMLITAGLNDPRVHYWEPAKWCAKLRDLKTDSNLLLLKTNMGAGHQGASGRYGYLEELAFDYAFVLDRLGLIAAGN